MIKIVLKELKEHVPFTFLGTVVGVCLLFIFHSFHLQRNIYVNFFGVLHPVHVLFSAVVTASMYKLHGRKGIFPLVIIGYIGSVGIATLSDCLLPYVGEVLLDLPYRGLHLGFIEKWWVINPLAFGGIVFAYFFPTTKLPHSGHVLLSTVTSLFHMQMAMGKDLTVLTMVLIGLFLFLSVWVPCCTSDIIFPLLFSRK